MKDTPDKILLVSGFVGGALFFATIYIILPLFYPGFDIATQTISELGESGSPVRIFANVLGFSMFGIFIMLFAFGVFRSNEINFLGKVASIFFFASGVLMYFVGVFYSESEFSLMSTLHNMSANYQFPVLAIGLVLFALGLTTNKRLRWLAPVILALGALTLFIAYFFFFDYDLTNRGIWQRFAIGIPYAIVMIISVTLLSSSARKTGSS